MEAEVWKSVKGFEGIYKVSNTGKVRCIERTVIRRNGRPLKIKGGEMYIGKDRYGYSIVNFNVNKKRYLKKVHRLVYESHIGDVNPTLVVDHIDNNKTNNHASNLQEITGRLNTSKDRVKLLGLPTGVYKNKNGMGYKVTIQKNGKAIYIGTYQTIEDARFAYKNALNGNVETARNTQRNGFKNGFKKCPTCGLTKKEDDYYWASKKRGVRHSKCKECLIKYNQKSKIVTKGTTGR